MLSRFIKLYLRDYYLINKVLKYNTYFSTKISIIKIKNIK